MIMEVNAVDDIITIGVVNFSCEWGNKQKNLSRICQYIRAAAAKGANLIIFPETALTGYDDEEEKEYYQKMHYLQAETISGESSKDIAALSRELNVYVIYGFPERDAENKDIIYNAAAVIGPDGIIGTYRKLHMPFSEGNWATIGQYPFFFETRWGRIGVGICYDSYAFPEIMRYYRAMGCRLYANVTAVGAGVTPQNVRTALEYLSATNTIYIATAGLFGPAPITNMLGGSSILGPGNKSPEVYYYAGRPFDHPYADQGELFVATIDLSYTERSFLSKQWDKEYPHWRPELYIKMYQEALEERTKSEEFDE